MGWMSGSGTREPSCPWGNKLPLKVDESFIDQRRRMGKEKGNRPIKDLYWISLESAEG